MLAGGLTLTMVKLRAPKMNAAAATAVLRAISTMAPPMAQGGRVALVASWMTHGASFEEIRARLHGTTATKWQEKMAFHAAAVEQCGLSVTLAQAERRRRATVVMRTLGKLVGRAHGEEIHGEPVASPRKRPAAVGCLPAAKQRRPTLAVHQPSRVIQWQPTKGPRAKRRLAGRASRYAPTKAAQRRQLANVRAMEIERIWTTAAGKAAQEAFFAIGTLYKKVKAWRQRGGACALPPISVLVKAVDWDRLPCPCASGTGHVWRVGRTQEETAPLDPRQLEEALASRGAAPTLETRIANGTTSEAEVRSLFGQATHGDALKAALGRALQKMRRRFPHWRQVVGVTIGLCGAGIGLSGLQAAELMGDDAQILWAAEGCPKARPAGEAVLAANGHSVRWVPWAQGTALAAKEWRTALEVITLRCAPFSPAGNGQGVDAAVAELQDVLEGTSSREPYVILYETTAGLWRRAEWRTMVEAALSAVAAYDWEVAAIDPLHHCDGFVSRNRVFYAGVRRCGSKNR